ncbi:MAG: TlyA family RNA methyltransferase [Clostridia bacterium]|nr:TlyA family RNA methyltransferase [Clostridia bacterium]
MRADKYLAERFASRTKAADAITRGLVLVNGKKITPSYDIKDGDSIEFLSAEESFVSAGGYKLSKAIKEFGYSAQGKIFADIGASTGGFTDCLLKNGARKIYCIDVGENQLDKSLDREKLVIIDNFNARNLTKNLFAEDLDGVVIDVSFISLTYILRAVSEILKEGASVLALIKPQFECESRKVGKNGIVKDRDVHERVLNKVCEFASGCGLIPKKLTTAPQVAGKNLEYLVLLEKGGESVDLKKLIKSVKL